MKTLLRGVLVFVAIVFTSLGIHNTFANSYVEASSTTNQQDKHQSRESYLKALDATLGKKSIFNISSLMRYFSSSTQYFNILGGDNKQNFKFYGVPHLFMGNTFTITNDSSSEDDINFVVYLLNSDGSRGSKVGGWYNDIRPGSSKTVSFRSNFSESRDFLIVIENDGYFWENNKRVSGSIRAHTY